MAKKSDTGLAKNDKKTHSQSKYKRTRQGNSCNTKHATHKNSKLYKKKYRGQGR